MFNLRQARHAARLKRRCKEQLQGVKIADPQAIDEVCRQLSIKRGRPLYLHELPDLGGAGAPCGLLVSFAAADHLFHVAATSERHRAQIIRHELAHLLLGHNNDNRSVVEALLAILPEEVEPAAVLDALGRTSYDSAREHDAELAASYLGELFDELAAKPGPGRQAAMARLDDAMFHPRRDRRS